MLGTKTNPVTEKTHIKVSNPSKDSGETCVVSEGTVLEGKFNASENVRLDGAVNGEVKCDKRLVMGEKGKVEGTVVTQDAVIMGTIIGDLSATGTLTLAGTAYVDGNIQAKFMVVEEGARYIGKCSIGN